MKKIISTYRFPAYAIILLFLASCSKDPLPPLVEFYGKLDEYLITFKVKEANVDTYLWDFGDGNTSTEKEPSHTYLKGGVYTVTLAVTGVGGETSRQRNFEVAISMEELLSGGPSVVNGKTWVMSKTYTPGAEGAGPFSDDVKLTQDAFENVLDYFRLADQYKDEFTFFSDGSYKVNPSDDGLILAGIIFGMKTGTIVKPSRYPDLLPLCASSYSPPAGGKWSLDYDDYNATGLVFNTSISNYEAKNITFHFNGSKNKVARLAFSDGQYIGIKDYSPLFVIKNISATSMVVGIPISIDATYWDKPGIILYFTFVPKN
ncbi:MAG: hypothetical protein A2W90_06820 [Bacteroidetes bacterium GWF2_42_66]|nr:MAG: hypothetical protein A2W92_01840 [Bacteroidetes bacterium GWA2_42_15]OFY02865.1 MAG: hypothetical protein A2W89_24225 [Bacteroidetes bacterium GWE2_42_39]OFY44520.1 MAG: hypothetical protein A2W90_06820 [Bacteroidetes bacterium GWF2_42_66]HAZ04633.1 hypothetical protein [Marinilabiliales bacterium]HBL74934.1 hypothetical protein [Prolixibacteraceae bacterium]